MAEKRLPIRTCVCCRKEFPKKELLRIVRSGDGKIFFDRGGKADGRGAYVCKSTACADKLLNKKLLGRVFSCVVPQEVYDELRGELLGSEKD